MPRNKIARFAEIKTLPNVLEKRKEFRGVWSKKYFKNDHPIILELACGRGGYTLGLAKIFPQINFIGVDRKGERVWYGAKTALEEKLNNVAFLRAPIDFLCDYFAPGEVSEIWITFPDPYRKDAQLKRRLTHQRFLKMFKKVLPPGGILHLKTDFEPLIDFTLEEAPKAQFEVREVKRDIPEEDENPLLNIRTAYELRHRKEGRKIYYVRMVSA